MEYLKGHNVRLFMPAQNCALGTSARTICEGIQYPLGVLNAIACATDCTIDARQETIATLSAVADFDNHTPGRKSWTLESDHLVTLDGVGGIDAMQSLMEFGEPVFVAITPSIGKDIVRDSETFYNSTPGGVRVGFATITAVRESYPLRGMATYRVSLRGTGPLTCGKRLLSGMSNIVAGSMSLQVSLDKYAFAMNYNYRIEICKYTPYVESGSVITPEKIGQNYATWAASPYYESSNAVNNSGTIFVDNKFQIFKFSDVSGKFIIVN